MIVGFDLDKIFIDYPPLVPSFLINRMYKKKSNGELWYRMPSSFEQKIRQLSHYSLFRPPIKENISFMEKLAEKNQHTYFLVSSRFGFLKKQTEDIVKKYGISPLFQDLFFNFKDQQPHIFKNEMMKKLKINVYIDDDLSLIKFLSKKNRDIKFYWFNKKQRAKINNNIIAITKLSQIKL